MRISAWVAAAGLLAASPWGVAADQPAAVSRASADGPADLVLLHGKVITVDRHDSVAQAIAIRGGRIIAVGTDGEVQALAGPKTQTIDLRGRAATPGLIDTHAHISQGGFSEVYGVRLSDASSVADIVARVKAAVARLKPGEWVQGEGWDEGKLSERRYVFAKDLDAVSPDNPVWLGQTTGHYGVANSYAMRLGKVGGATKDPPAGTIDRDAQGAPTGVLKESAQDLVSRLIPEPSVQQLQTGIAHMLEELHREGMTAFKDPLINPSVWAAYKGLLDSGKLTADVCVLWGAGATVASAQKALASIQAQPRPPASLGDGRLLSCGAKIFMDGSGGARTAWLYKEWNKNFREIDRGNFGYPAEEPEVYRQQVRLLHQAGVNVGTHAIGDHAIDWVVDTYAQLLAEKPTKGLRHSIIHGNLPTDHAVETMAMLQKKYDAGYPEMQAEFLWWIGDNYAANFGQDRSQHLVPLKTLETRGVRWSGGSDFPVTPIPARLGIWSAVDRQTLKGTWGSQPFGTAESVDIHSVLRAYTANAAPALFLENRTGSLEKGKDADIAVWDKDPYTVPSKELRDLKCQLTIFRGKVVYQAP